MNKQNTSLIAIIAIFAIFFITWLTLRHASNQQIPTGVLDSSLQDQSDLSGQASEALISSQSGLCKIIVGQTTVYDESNLAATLPKSSSSYFLGYRIMVTDMTDDGCVIDINGNTDFIAQGQIQKIGDLYVTVREVMQ